jgi:hypothetical protein
VGDELGVVHEYLGERGCQGLKTRYGLRGKRVATAAAATLAVVAIAVVIGLRRPWAVAVQPYDAGAGGDGDVLDLHASSD